MTVLFSLSVIFFAIWMIALQITYANQTKNDEFRYQYFALRDRLAMLAINGRISEESSEYQKIISAINFHIKAVETVSVLRIARLLASYHTSSDEDKQIELIMQKGDDEEVKQLMIDFLCITMRLLKRNSRAQIATLKLLSKMNFRSPSKDIKLEVAKPKTAIEKLQKNVSKLEGSLHNGFAPA